MAIVAGDIHYRLSGGSGNSNPAASLGGVMSTTTDASTNIFDDVSGAESAAGDTEYRGVYIFQDNTGSLSYLGVRVWVSADTPSSTTDADIALADEAVGSDMETIANESTAPVGPVFANTAVDYASGLQIGDIPDASRKGVWLKRVINAGTAAATDGFTITCQGDTNP